MTVFHLLGKLEYSIKDDLNLKIEVFLEEENDKIALQISPKIESLNVLGRLVTNFAIFQLKCFEIYNLRRNSSLPVLSRFCNKLLGHFQRRYFVPSFPCSKRVLVKVTPIFTPRFVWKQPGAKDNPEIAYCTELT